MADQQEDSLLISPPPFLEVTCKVLGKPTRFAAGTKAGFAVYLINRKLENGGFPLISHIEAVTAGEEPICFGPDAVLVDFGSGWKLQTVVDLDHVVRKEERMERIRPISSPTRNVAQDSGGSGRAKTESETSTGFNVLYVGKILVAFILIFVLGATLTFALENLPKLILFLNSFM